MEEVHIRGSRLLKERDLEAIVVQILAEYEIGLTFEELREVLERRGYYVDGLTLRKCIAHLINSNTICKTLLSSRRRFLLTLCRRGRESS